jgi:hypothetical protein
MLIAPIFSMLLVTAQDTSSRLKEDAMDARQQLVVIFHKVGQTFRTFGQDVARESKEGGVAVGHGAAEAGKAVASGATSFGRNVKKRAKKVGQGVKEAFE